MVKKIISATIAFLLVSYSQLLGQVTPEPFVIRDSNRGINNIDFYIIKGGNKSYEFKADTSSADYKELCRINPNWIEAIDILKNQQLRDGTKTVVVITLKKKKVNELSSNLKGKLR
ncbi:MAG TPA: hypothetical protein VGQ59_02855 [Cyclobacteriaceae bacterium]|jgi:hypothetical protein|nr:hypothetical protein [Cyclobacteriaceae bacterium]